jgi:cytidylate kinase
MATRKEDQRAMAILTIARAYGSGGKAVGEGVAKLLNYDYVDRGRVLEDMRRVSEKWEDQAEYFDENYPGFFERYDWSFRGYVALNQCYFLDYALKDRVVIMGRGGNFLLKGIPFSMRIRVQAPIEKRVERIMTLLEMNRENAKYLIEKADREMAGAVYLIYGRHWDDPDQYDYVFDTSKQTIEEIVETVTGELLKRDQLRTPEAEAILRLRVISAKIKAALRTSPGLTISDLDVDPKEEGMIEYGVVLRGIVHELNDVKEAGEIAKKIAGDIPVDNQLQYKMFSRLR